MCMCVLQYICICIHTSSSAALCTYVYIICIAYIRVYVRMYANIASKNTTYCHIRKCIKMPSGPGSSSVRNDNVTKPESVFIHLSDLSIIL